MYMDYPMSSKYSNYHNINNPYNSHHQHPSQPNDNYSSHNRGSSSSGSKIHSSRMESAGNGRYMVSHSQRQHQQQQQQEQQLIQQQQQDEIIQQQQQQQLLDYQQQQLLEYQQQQLFKTSLYDSYVQQYEEIKRQQQLQRIQQKQRELQQIQQRQQEIQYNQQDRLQKTNNHNRRPLIYELEQYEDFNKTNYSDNNDYQQNYNNQNNQNNTTNYQHQQNSERINNNINNSHHNNNNSIISGGGGGGFPSTKNILKNTTQHIKNNIKSTNFTANQLLRKKEKILKKMEREDIAIEHSQLVGNGNVNNHHHIVETGTMPNTMIPAAAASATGNGGFGTAAGGGGGGGGTDDDGSCFTTVQLHRSRHFTQIIAALAVSLGPLAAGLGKGYTSPAIASLQDIYYNSKDNNTTFEVTNQQSSWIASLSLLGALFGGMFGGLAMKYGRKKVLTIMALPFSISWIVTIFAKSVETMFMTAFSGGFCCSIVSMVTQVYISEIASPDIRGFLSAIQKMAGHLGVLISYLLGAYLDWRQLAMLVSVAPIMLFISVIYIPETPSFLVLNGQVDDAYRSLQWLRGSHKNVEVELDTIRLNVRNARTKDLTPITPFATDGFMTRLSLRSIITNIKAVMKNVRLLKPISITCGLMFFQRFTGANSFGFYAVNVFRQTFSIMSPHSGAIAVAFVQLLASMLSGILIDTIGRIPLLIISSCFMTLALACFGSYINYENQTKILATNDFEVGSVTVNNDWIPLLCVLVFTIAFSLGISPISWLLIGELFPLEYRGIGSSIATSFSYFCAFLGVKTFVDFQEYLGLHGAFWLYGGIAALGLCFVITAVPETKGRDLDEMHPNPTPSNSEIITTNR